MGKRLQGGVDPNTVVKEEQVGCTLLFFRKL